LASFEVIFKNSEPKLNARVDYKNFDNEDKSEIINLPVKVYTSEEALELGLISKSKAGLYIGIVFGLLIIWFIYRKIKKRRRNNKNRKGI